MCVQDHVCYLAKCGTRISMYQSYDEIWSTRLQWMFLCCNGAYPRIKGRKTRLEQSRADKISSRIRHGIESQNILVLRGVAQSPDINSHERFKARNLVGSNDLDPPKDAMALVAYSSRGLHMSLHPNATNVLGVGLSINPLHPLLASSRHDQRFFLPVVILRASAIAQYSLRCVVYSIHYQCRRGTLSVIICTEFVRVSSRYRHQFERLI
mmetsp:Transcript_40735/g.65590  ORF Transcript_40735/g.65590 Transcript_40735/m.65590 type:complete len:210 (-) Transcript_40735:351-980(-)